MLKSFSRERPAQTISEVATCIGVTRATARRLLLTLSDLGYVGSDGRRFFLRPSVLTIGYTFLSLSNMWQGAQTHLDSLAARAGESCGAAVLDGPEAVHVVRAIGDDILAVNLVLGVRLPAYCTAVGKVLLAELDEAELDDYLRRVDLVRRTAATVVEPARLRASLEEVRDRGWALDDEEWRTGVRAIAVPIRDGETVGAVDIVCLSSQAPVQRLESDLLPLLLKAADHIGARVPSG